MFRQDPASPAEWRFLGFEIEPAFEIVVFIQRINTDMSRHRSNKCQRQIQWINAGACPKSRSCAQCNTGRSKNKKGQPHGSQNCFFSFIAHSFFSIISLNSTLIPRQKVAKQPDYV
jgi:hypothetical protein